MKLANGITGFYNSEANKPQYVDWKQFKQLCFDFASSNGGKVQDFNPPQYSANFYNAQVEFFNMRFNILLNEYYPYLAFASDVEFGNINFIDIPVLFEQFTPYYQVLNTGELNIPVKKIFEAKYENLLNSTELVQLDYWKPETIGQVIFNYWD